MRHWTEQELLAHLYGVGPEDNHLDLCESCRTRLSRMETIRSTSPECQTPADFLAAQRRAIYQRVSRGSPRFPFRFGQAMAAAAMLVCAVLLTLPAPVSYSSAPDVSGPVAENDDATFYIDVYQQIYNEAPHAAEPLHGLFE